jgi:hypothetical protein
LSVSVLFDHAEYPGGTFEQAGGKQCSELTYDSQWALMETAITSPFLSKKCLDKLLMYCGFFIQV